MYLTCIVKNIQKEKFRNKQNGISDVEIMVILILFHSGGFRYFKYYYKELLFLSQSSLVPIQYANLRQRIHTA